MRIVSTLVAILLFSAGTADAGVLMYGIENGFGSDPERLHVINPATADVISTVTVTLPGHTVQNANGLAADPTNFDLYAVLRTQSGGPAGNRLVTIDPITGVSTLIGTLSDNFAGLAFLADGSLIGITGDGAATPETLFEIDKTDASSSLLFARGPGNDGETIATHSNGLLYHASGRASDDKPEEIFESVDLDTLTPTLIVQGDLLYNEASALGYSQLLDLMFVADLNLSLYTIDVTTGDVTVVGDMTGYLQGPLKGIAFIPEPGSLMLLSLGGLMLARRRC